MKILFLLWICLFTAACSSFDQRWKTDAIAATPNTLAGRWSGEWASFTTHRGELRAMIFADPAKGPATGPATRLYHANFKATFWYFYSAEYAVDFTAVATADGETFSGSKDLGYFGGGLYHYEGVLHHDDLQCNYQCPLDHGVFTLHRVEEKVVKTGQ